MTLLGRSLLAIAMLAPMTAAADAAPFSRADANNDGFATYEEILRIYPELTGVYFRKFDRDGDGALDSGEFAAFSAFADIMMEEY